MVARKKKVGNPDFKEFVPQAWHRLVVRALKGVGEKNITISNCIIDPETGKGISVPTLLKYFPAELGEGKLVSCGRIVNSLYRQALRGNVKAAQVLLVALAPEEWGFRAYLRIPASKHGGDEVPPAKNEPIGEGIVDMTDEELEKIIRDYEN